MEIRNEKNLLNAAVLGLAVLATYKLWQSVRQMFWSAFGIGWVVYWTGGWPFFSWF
jgi:hypothetical protein